MSLLWSDSRSWTAAGDHRHPRIPAASACRVATPDPPRSDPSSVPLRPSQVRSLASPRLPWDVDVSPHPGVPNLSLEDQPHPAIYLEAGEVTNRLDETNLGSRVFVQHMV